MEFIKHKTKQLALSFVMGVKGLEGRNQRFKLEPYPPIQRAELGMLKVLLTPTFHNTYSKQKDSYKFISQEKCALAEEVSFSYCYEGRTKVLGAAVFIKKNFSIFPLLEMCHITIVNILV